MSPLATSVASYGAGLFVSTARSRFMLNVSGGWSQSGKEDDEDVFIDNPRRESRKHHQPRGYSRDMEESSFLKDMLGNSKQLGVLLLAAGLFVTMLGIMLLFEKNLLRLGNIGLLSGIALMIGPNKLGAFFLKESRMQATIITSVGVILMFVGRPRLGLTIEIFGLLNLFGNMFPVLLAVGKRLPLVGDLLETAENVWKNQEPPDYTNHFAHSSSSSKSSRSNRSMSPQF